MGKSFDWFFSLIPGSYILAVLPLTIFVYWLRHNRRVFFGERKGTDADRVRLDNDLKARLLWIEKRSFEQRYISLLGRGLDIVSERLTKDANSLSRSPPTRGWTGRLFGLNPFTEGSYLLCLRLALIYPLLGFVLGWLLGGDGTFSGLTLLPDGDGGSRLGRLLLVGTLALVVWLFWKLSVTGGRWKWLYSTVAFAFFVTAAFAATYAYLGDIGGNYDGRSAMVFSFAGAAAFSAACLFAGFFAFSVAFSGAGTFSGTFSGAGTAAAAFVFAGAGAFAFAVAFADTDFDFVAGGIALTVADAVTEAFAFVVAVSFAFATGWLRDRLDSPVAVSRYWAGYNILLVALLVSVAAWVLSRTTEPDILLLLVFLGLLPLVNAALDWVSLGFTRGLLSAIRHGHHTGGLALLWVVLDVILALLFLFGIASLIILVLAGTNAASVAWGGKPLLDLLLLLDGLSLDPWSLEYGWIHFMMLSTLIPTLFHLFIASFALVLVLPDRTRRWILAKWDQRDDVRTIALWYVSLIPVLAFAGAFLMLWGLWELLTAGGGVVGRGLLDWVREIAALVDPCVSSSLF